jgi:hypothetical protein
VGLLLVHSLAGAAAAPAVLPVLLACWYDRLQWRWAKLVVVVYCSGCCFLGCARLHLLGVVTHLLEQV